MWHELFWGKKKLYAEMLDLKKKYSNFFLLKRNAVKRFGLCVKVLGKFENNYSFRVFEVIIKMEFNWLFEEWVSFLIEIEVLANHWGSTKGVSSMDLKSKNTFNFKTGLTVQYLGLADAVWTSRMTVVYGRLLIVTPLDHRKIVDIEKRNVKIKTAELHT